MSRTYKDDKDRRVTNFYRDYFRAYPFRWITNPGHHILGGMEQQFLIKNKKYIKNKHELSHNYNSHAPSWWVNLMMTRRARRLDSRLLHKCIQQDNEMDSFLFSLARKPWVYYD